MIPETPYCTPYCPVCPRRYRPISGSGPTPSPILIVGERPGKDENIQGKVFIGKTGQELDRVYLPLAGLNRRDVRVCNTVRCWADNNRTPSDKEIQGCAAHHLPFELHAADPSIVILMGASACKLLPHVQLEMEHGIPHYGRLYNWEGIVVPMYHPALGLHDSKWMTQIMDDWRMLMDRLDRLSLPEPAYDKDTDYRLITLPEIVHLDLRGKRVAVDTETHGDKLYSVQFSENPGTGRFFLAGKETCLAFGEKLARAKEILFHNRLYDYRQLQRAGCIRDDCAAYIRDTMQEAYHLSNLPQGLKPLVYRLFGYRMKSWEDVVWPHSIRALEDWISEALQLLEQEFRQKPEPKTKPKSKRKPVKAKPVKAKPHPLETALIRIASHISVESTYDPWERLKKLWIKFKDIAVYIESRTGSYPVLGIGNVPLDEAVAYGCSDADWTLRLSEKLAEIRAAGTTGTTGTTGTAGVYTIEDCDADI